MGGEGKREPLPIDCLVVPGIYYQLVACTGFVMGSLLVPWDTETLVCCRMDLPHGPKNCVGVWTYRFGFDLWIDAMTSKGLNITMASHVVLFVFG